MTWSCPAITNGLAVFPDDKIRPCCQIDPTYFKPLSEINNPNRFLDLNNGTPPRVCETCHKNEALGLPSYRKFFQLMHVPTNPGIHYLDFRHTNHCNLKCRYCNPHFSNQWALELKLPTPLMKTDISQYYDKLLTSNLVDLYWCGGEPLIIKDHYDVLIKLIDLKISKNVSLRYNTNLTVLQYKNVNLYDLWKEFKSVNLSISLDAAGPELNYIRSGSNWDQILENINTIQSIRLENLSINLATTVSLLNVWFLPELFQFANDRNIPVGLTFLKGPDYLSLSAIYGVDLKDLAISKFEKIKSFITDSEYMLFKQMLSADDNRYLFDHAVRHILLLDSLRNEKLFDILPFKQTSIQNTVINFNYE